MPTNWMRLQRQKSLAVTCTNVIGRCVDRRRGTLHPRSYFGGTVAPRRHDRLLKKGPPLLFTGSWPHDSSPCGVEAGCTDTAGGDLRVDGPSRARMAASPPEEAAFGHLEPPRLSRRDPPRSGLGDPDEVARGWRTRRSPRPPQNWSVGSCNTSAPDARTFSKVVSTWCGRSAAVAGGTTLRHQRLEGVALSLRPATVGLEQDDVDVLGADGDRRKPSDETSSLTSKAEEASR